MREGLIIKLRQLILVSEEVAHYGEGRLADAGALSESLRGGREEALPAYEGNVYVARTYMDAPGVDGYLYIHTGKREFMTGDMPLVRITGAYEYDLTGELVNEDESAQ